MKRLILICLLVPPLALTACGESKQDKAKKQVCSARSDIQKQVNSLKSLTPATVTANGVKDSLNSIKNDLTKMKDAQPDLNDQRKQQVQTANQEFASQFNSITSNLGSNLSISGAAAQLQTAGQQLSAAYTKSLAPIDCS